MTDELKAKIEAIRELAGKATPGPWVEYGLKSGNGNSSHTVETGEPGVAVCRLDSQLYTINCAYNAAYIAAANPQTLLEILAYIDQLEKEYAVKQDTIDQQNGIIAKLLKEIDWIAEFALGGECPPEYEYARAGGAVVRCHHDCKECWKEAAEDAVDGVE